MLGLIAEHTGQPLERIGEDSVRDRGYRADQALEYGFIDSVLDSLEGVGHAGVTAPGLGGCNEHLHDPQRGPHHPRGERVMDVYSHLFVSASSTSGPNRRRRVRRADRTDPAPGVGERGPESTCTSTPPVDRSPPRSRCTTRWSWSGARHNHVRGQACLTAAILLAAGAPGHRGVLPHARVLLHQPSARGRAPSRT